MKKDQKTAPILDAAKGYAAKRPVYFCIPGHRYENGAASDLKEFAGSEMFKIDLTETPLTDDLHDASGAIAEAQELAAELWGADRSYFLVNGSSCGNQAMIMSSAFEGQSIIIPRNAHKSAFAGLVLSGAKPIYITPNTVYNWGFSSGITTEQVETALSQNPECKAVMIVSPSYFGIVSDIEGIAEACHKHGAALIVDEAHGAHCYFSNKLPKGALACGADACVQSIHKTAGALTQSSLLHLRGNLIDRNAIEANLKIVQSSSPSYLLMSSIDAARKDLACYGKEMTEKALSLAAKAREEINKIPGFCCAGKELKEQAGVFDFDETRLVIKYNNGEISGFELKEYLFENCNIDLELASDKAVLAIVTHGNTEDDIARLFEALKHFASEHRSEDAENMGPDTALTVPKQRLTPRQAYFSAKRRVNWNDCVGMISGEMIAPYPPGIPAIYPGEEISKEVWDLLEGVKKRKGRMHGPSDPSLDTILVI